MGKRGAADQTKIHCVECEATVVARVVGEHVREDFEEAFNGFVPSELFQLVECPSKHVLLVTHASYGENDMGGTVWSAPVRAWPRPENDSNLLIPEIVRISLEEANRSFTCGTYTACTVMCGRALEGLCRHHGAKGNTFGERLKDLSGRAVIDQLLLRWSQELRLSRDEAAHATGVKVTQQDARDELDFMNAICEYVFVLTPKFEAYLQRKGMRKGKRKSTK